MHSLPKSIKLFVISIIWLPQLFQYTTPLPGLTYGDCFLMLTGLIYYRYAGVRLNKLYFPLILYIVVLSFWHYFNGSLLRITTTIHYLLYLFIVMMMRKLVIYRDYYLNIYKIACLISIGLMVVQTIVLQTVGFCIPGVLTFLPLTDAGMYNYTDAVLYHNSGRCMSLFGEPSHFAVYVLPFLVLNLFPVSKVDKNKIFYAILISVSLIMCASFTGILSACLIWGLFVAISVASRRLSFKSLLFLLFIFLILLQVFSNSFGGDYLSNEEIYERQSEGRFVGFLLFERMDISNTQLFLGAGMNDIAEEIYLPGWPRLLYYFGIVGSIIYVLTLLSSVRLNTVSFLLLLLLGVLMVGSEINFGIYFVLIMSCIYITRDIKLLI